MAGIAYGILCIWKANKTWSWKSCNGLVIASSITEDYVDHDETEHIIYEYEVDGKKYTNNIIQIGVPLRFTFQESSQSTAKNRIQRYPLMKAVKVYYNPQKPKEACLQQGIECGTILFLAIFLVIFCIGLFPVL